MPSKKIAVLLVVLTTFLTTTAQLFFKEGSQYLPKLTAFLFFGILIYAFASLLLVYAFKGGEVSSLYPIMASSYLWVAVFAWFFFQESFTLFKLLGLGCIFMGVSLLGYHAQQSTEVLS
ncbi:EamA family transporter [Candidatus Woesearchaeota archaeon]|nr:EamA family transporter [Candidatus Woesearchaeota archaeon]